METFDAEAPAMNPARALITGAVCSVRVEAVEDPLMREVRYLDKLVDELARGEGDGEDFAGVGATNSSGVLVRRNTLSNLRFCDLGRAMPVEFQAWLLAVDREFMRRIRIDQVLVGFSDEEMIGDWQRREAPADWVTRIGEKYDLDPCKDISRLGWSKLSG